MTVIKKGRKRKTSELDTLQLNLFDMAMTAEALQEELTAPAEQVSFIRIIKNDTPTTSKITVEEVVPLTPAGKNYRIKPEDLSYFGGSKVKFNSNLEAIKCLKKIEDAERMATEEEQAVLVRYVGWGGLADAFNERNASWAKEYTQLKELLTNEEYEAARTSTLNAHYTADFIIKGMYQALANMGFEKGNILEPSLGVGHFFGLLPEEMCESKLYGVELDSLTGRMAKQLYPKANIQICGFEDMNYPDNFFDVAIGNIPFGDYKVYDKAYEKQNFLIHDYFLAKMTDKVRPGGVVAVITSKGTMDKVSTSVRKYLAQRVELLGAIRLPNTAFKNNAGTEVTSDILFFKKLDTIETSIPSWVNIGENEDGIQMNQYFVEHSEMILGEMTMVSGPFGMESTCKPYPNSCLEEELSQAIKLIEGTISKVEFEDDEEKVDEGDIIPADISVKNYSYTLVDDEVYFRENANMFRVKGAVKRIQRIKGMIALRDCVTQLLNMQLEDYSEADICEKRAELNRLYDAYIAKFGILNSKGNKMAFGRDDAYFLLASLENLDEFGNLKSKADIFSKRTIAKSEVVTTVDTASEALVVSLREHGCVDLEYMAELSSKSIETLKDELIGVIFENPSTGRMETSEEYLSGNVRKKLDVARVYASENPKYLFNVEALEKVQPEDLTAAEIEVKLGATWIDAKYINQFMIETFNTPTALVESKSLIAEYSRVGDSWNISGKSIDSGNPFVINTFGTKRVNAYRLLEDALNLKDTRVFDTEKLPDGTTKRVLNKDETTLAMQKQEDIKNAFKEWIFNDVDRREVLCRIYNDTFNAIRPRQYNGSHLNFAGMTPDITLKQHQKDAIALILHGGNALLAHEVGLGKTFEMVAGAMESKRLGLCQKSLFVVPNHLTEQIGADFLKLYPSAKILISTKKDFETKNRKKFCSRIATGDYDAVIIGHTQFEKIPLSSERQSRMIRMEIHEILDAIAEAKDEDGSNFTIKQMEAKRKQLEVKLERLVNESKKDNVITFEQLGVDRLFVDEAHSYKNCAGRCSTTGV